MCCSLLHVHGMSSQLEIRVSIWLPEYLTSRITEKISMKFGTFDLHYKFTGELHFSLYQSIYMSDLGVLWK